jgi:hypothetical protein
VNLRGSCVAPMRLWGWRERRRRWEAGAEAQEATGRFWSSCALHPSGGLSTFKLPGLPVGVKSDS